VRGVSAASSWVRCARRELGSVYWSCTSRTSRSHPEQPLARPVGLSCRWLRVQSVDLQNPLAASHTPSLASLARGRVVADSAGMLHRPRMKFVYPTAHEAMSSDLHRASNPGCATPSGFPNLSTCCSARTAVPALFHAGGTHGLAPPKISPPPMLYRLTTALPSAGYDRAARAGTRDTLVNQSGSGLLHRKSPFQRVGVTRESLAEPPLTFCGNGIPHHGTSPPPPRGFLPPGPRLL
jgi:hypothetical protein